jgi:hypothetical protein
MLNNSDRSFKVKFNASSNSFSKMKFNRTQNTFKPKAEVTPVETDIYYDEIIYYDGGDVHGYGDD